MNSCFKNVFCVYSFDKTVAYHASLFVFTLNESSLCCASKLNVIITPKYILNKKKKKRKFKLTSFSYIFNNTYHMTIILISN